MRALADRFVRWVARLATLGWFRAVDVSGLERIPRTGPVLVVANHHTGFVDPALLLATIPRPVHFLAMDRLWRVWPLRPVLALAGAIPVRRPQDATGDGGGAQRNVDAFAASFEHLRRGGAIGVFPEGESSDAPHLLPIRTGAARIALGAHARGAMGLRIVPVGLIAEDKQRARSRAYVRVGEPIVLDEDLAEHPGVPPDERDRPAVLALTEEIERRLADAAIDYESAAQRAELRFAAITALRWEQADPRGRPPVGEIERLADALAEAPEEVERPVRAAAIAYRDALAAADVPDAVVAPGAEAAFRDRSRLGRVVTLAMLPFAVVGAVANALPALGVYLTGLRAAPPAMHATTKFLAGIALFLVNLGLLRWVVLDETSQPWLLTLVVGPICGLAALWVTGRLLRARGAGTGFGGLAAAADALEDLRARRARLVEAVRAARQARRDADDAGSLGVR
jgi:glycerol-3-phosphate O-acyltransferase / dihydroxyacetone phosphate acyltransferase